MSSLESVQERLRAGYFNEALELLREDQPRRPSAAWLSIEAEILERTGRVREAVNAAERACRIGTEPRWIAQALIVLGVIEREQGRSTLSVDCFRRARELAVKCGAMDLVARAMSRLLLSEFEDQADLDIDGRLHVLMKDLNGWADSATIAALQAFASEAYAKKGDVKKAHICLAQAGERARTIKNPWLEGLLALSRFCLSYLEMDYEQAEQSASDALRFAQVSGHVRTELAAIVNLAHVSMQRRRYEEAERAFRRALAMSDISARVRDYTIEGLARLQLLRGDYDGSTELIDATSTGATDAYSRLWRLLTAAEVALRRGAYEECERICRQALGEVEHVGGSAVAIQLNMALAESLAFQRRLAAAGDVLANVRSMIGGSSLGVQSAMGVRVAQVLHTIGLHEEAETVSRRAIRAKGDTASALATIDAGGRWGTNVDRARCGGLVVDRLVAIYEQSGDRQLALAETVDLLTELGCCDQWTVVERAPDRQVGLCGDGSVMLPLLGDQASGVLVQSGKSPHGLQVLTRVARLLSLLEEGIAPSRQSGAGTPESSIAEVMQPVLQMARRAARSDIPVLILGETGVGKEWLSRQIHQWSRRSGGRFLGFNCSAVPREMLDAQLFGHRRGAFTGALDNAIGVIRAAAGGTLLLDEIGDVPPDVQVKLLRFLEGNEVHPIGESVPVSVDVRVLAATNQDPEQLVNRGVLRKDLYYRINVVTIRIPPLRERGDEILTLARRFLSDICREMGKGELRLSRRVQEIFREYSWPGNVRQLLNELRRAVALTEGSEEIRVEVLSEALREAAGSIKAKASAGPAVTIPLDQKLSSAVAALERAAIERALEISGGRRDAAAMLLGLSRKGLYLKCRRMKMKYA